MANFSTHLAIGTVVSGATAAACSSGGLVTANQAISGFLIGTIGSLLPDLDSDNSTIVKLVFSLFGIVAAIAFSVKYFTRYSIVELLLIWTFIYYLFTMGVGWLFKSRTRHRGLFHSIPAMLLFGFLTAILFHKGLKSGPVVALVYGLFMMVGYVTHLALDEVFSVDLANAAIKSSFGSAIKLFDTKNWIGTILIWLLVLVSAAALPNPQLLWLKMKQNQTVSKIKQDLLPRGKRWLMPR